MTELITPIKTQGKKTKLLQEIKKIIEINDKVYIEPFLGSGVVLFNLNPEKAYVSDNNIHIINFYKNIQNGSITPENARQFLEFHGNKLREIGKEYYYVMRDEFNKNHNSLYFLFLNRSCFNGVMRFNKKGEFNVPFCNKKERFSKALITKICNQIDSVKKIIDSHGDNWHFECSDWEETINKFSNTEAVYYFDPPYIARNATYFDEWTDEKNDMFFKKIKKLNGTFVLSNWYENYYRKNLSLIDNFPVDEYIFNFIEHFYYVGGEEKNRNSISECLVVKKNS